MPSPPSGIDLKALAIQSMRDHGFEPTFSREVEEELARLDRDPPAQTSGEEVRDLLSLPWSSIDNDTSRDLDQIEVAETVSAGQTKILVGIADVDSLVRKGSAIDRHAARQTTSIYTGVEVFPMLPEALSTQKTSLLPGFDRLCVVIEFVADRDGQLSGSNLYRARARNQAQLSYDRVGGWLGGSNRLPQEASGERFETQLRLQDQVAQALRAERTRRGATEFDTGELHPVVRQGEVIDLEEASRNRATELIEDFMIAANGVVARFLAENNRSAIRRIVRKPKRWDRMVRLAEEKGGTLPAEPDSGALSRFMTERKAADPDGFADLSLAMIKLMGPGEYVLERPGDPVAGHFGLAVRDYAHSTAPNRRFSDLLTQRLLKEALAGRPAPYSDAELEAAALACTTQENAARKVEREMAKRIAALALRRDIGRKFEAIVTGVTPSGTFVRTRQPRVEGLLAQGAQGVDVGDRIQVKLVSTNVQKGYIDFARA